MRQTAACLGTVMILAAAAVTPSDASSAPWRQTAFLIGGVGSTSLSDTAIFNRLNNAGVDLVTPTQYLPEENRTTWGTIRERALGARTLLKLQGPAFSLKMLAMVRDSIAITLDTLSAYSTVRHVWVEDEPAPEQTPQAAAKAQSVPDSLAALVNLYPPYVSFFAANKPISYPAYVGSYLSAFSEPPAPVVSVDHYMYQDPALPKDDFLFTLRTLRDQAAAYSTLDYRTPMWVWIQLADDTQFSGPLGLAEIHLEAFTALAYGAKGIFYWTLAPFGGTWSTGILDGTGDTTTVVPGRYSGVRALNAELHTLGRTLVGLDPIAVMHVDTLGQRFVADELFSNPTPKVQIAANADNAWCMVGYLRGRTEPYGDYLLIVNKDTAASHSFTVTLETRADSVFKIRRSDGGTSLVGTNLTAITTDALPAGTGDLYRVVTWTRRRAALGEGAYPALAVSRLDGRRGIFYSETSSLSSIDLPENNYYVQPPHLLRYAYDSLGVWSHVTVDQDDAAERSATMDVQGRPWVAYQYSPAGGTPAVGGLKCAHWSGTAWVVEPVATYGVLRAPIARYPSLAIDFDGRPMIACWDSIDAQVRFASKPGAQWVIEPVATVTGATDVVPSLAIDGAGHPGVAYVELSGGAPVLRLAVKLGETWTRSTVDSGRAAYGWPALRYDCNSVPHIAYTSIGPGGGNVVRYASLSGGTWSSEVADSVPGDGEMYLKGVALELDGKNRPRICYSGSKITRELLWEPPYRDAIVRYPLDVPTRLTVRVRYAAKETSWQGEYIDPYHEYQFTSLRLDRDGRPSVAYLGDGNLTVASRSSWVSSGEVAAPRISSLRKTSCDPETSEWTVEWTSPADDSTCAPTGPATSYVMRTYGWPITLSNWSMAEEVSVPAPAWPGVTQSASVAVSGLTYCRMMAYDKAGNGELSNQASMLPCYGDGSFVGGGGEWGGFGNREVSGQARSLSRGGEDGMAAPDETSVLSWAKWGVPGRDLVALPRSVEGGRVYKVYVRAAAGRRLDIDAARLLVVDHPDGSEAVSDGRTLHVGQRVVPVSARDELDHDVTAAVDGSGMGFIGQTGSALSIETALDSVMSPVVIDAVEEGGVAHPIMVESRESGGGWRVVGTVIPRVRATPCVVDSVPAGQFRLEFAGGARVNSVGRISILGTAPTTSWAVLDSAWTGAVARAGGSVSVVDSTSVSLAGPDTLSLQFSAAGAASGMVRDLFLCVDATPWLANQTPTATLGGISRELSAPARFALWQNQPNPFRAGTTIRFDLPVGQVVHLEVFDAQGRLVRELVNRYMPAGYQSAYWDNRDASGGAVRPGVFFYRLRTDVFRDRKKMVLLP